MKEQDLMKMLSQIVKEPKKGGGQLGGRKRRRMVIKKGDLKFDFGDMLGIPRRHRGGAKKPRKYANPQAAMAMKIAREVQPTGVLRPGVLKAAWARVKRSEFM